FRKERGQWATDREALTRELCELRARSATWAMGVADLDNARRGREIAERHVETMEALVKKYEDDVNRLRSLYEQPKEVEARIGVIEEPYIQRADVGPAPGDERGWLEQIR